MDKPLRELPHADWEVHPTTPSPVETDGPPVDLVLVPYGCTNLRIAEFPLARG